MAEVDALCADIEPRIPGHCRAPGRCAPRTSTPSSSPQQLALLLGVRPVLDLVAAYVCGPESSQSASLRTPLQADPMRLRRGDASMATEVVPLASAAATAIVDANSSAFVSLVISAHLKFAEHYVVSNGFATACRAAAWQVFGCCRRTPMTAAAGAAGAAGVTIVARAAAPTTTNAVAAATAAVVAAATPAPSALAEVARVLHDAPHPDVVAKQLRKNATRVREDDPSTTRGGLNRELTFVKPHELLDVWYCRAPLPEPVHDALVRDVQRIADATRDHFVVSYQNVIDPNLCLARLSDDEIARIDGATGAGAGGALRVGRSAAANATACAVRTAELLAKRDADVLHGPLKADAAVRRATVGALGPVAPDPLPNTPEHAAAAELAALSYQYRWRATTVRVEYGPEPVGPATPPGGPAASAAAANDVAAAAGAPAAGANRWRVTLTSPIQELKRESYAGLYQGVEHVFGAVWPLLRTLYNWRSPCKGDGCDDGFALGLTPDTSTRHDVYECAWCEADRNHQPYRAPAARAHDAPATHQDLLLASRARLAQPCPWCLHGVFACWRMDDERTTDAHDARTDVDTSVAAYTEGAPHPFADFAGPQPPDQRRPAQHTPPLRHWRPPKPVNANAAAAAAALRKPQAPVRTGAADFQIVVKAQKVVIQPGATYQGVWHDEGLHERVIAVAVYYFSVPACVQGGGVQFASKGRDGLNDARPASLRSAWRARPKCVVDIKDRDCLLFSNYQLVHRVLALHNASDTPVTREFVCLFVVDPRHPLPTTTRAAAFRSAFASVAGDTATAPLLPPEVVDCVLEYTGEHMGLAQRQAMRRAVFTCAMRPKQLGAWVLYSNGNGDCQNVVWSTADDDDSWTSALLRGTTSDEPMGADGYASGEERAKNLLKAVPGYERGLPPATAPAAADGKRPR